MPSLNVIINGSSQPFERELQKLDRLAQQTAARVNRSFADGGHGGVKSGVISEMLVAIREISRGNLTRLPGSLSILAQRLGLLKYLSGGTASAARVLAEAWAVQAEKAGAAAIASTQKASASYAALYADDSETEATLNAAVADERKAAADIQVAAATRVKAIASQDAAYAAESEAGAATTSIGPLGVVLGILTGIGVGAYAANKLVKNLTDTLAGVKPPENFEPEYIVKRLQHGNAAAEGQREVNQEIEKSIRLYYSAAEVAKRSEETTKSHYDHLRKMNELHERAELNGATSDAARKAIRKKYSDANVQVDKDERAQQISEKRDEKSNLEHESAAAKAKADAIDVPSKQQDENDLRLAEAKLATLKTAADAIEKSKNDPGFLNTINGRDAIRAYNAISPTGVSGKDLNAAEKQVATDRTSQEMAVRQLKEQNDQHGLARSDKDDLTKQAAMSAGKAAVIGAQLPGMVQSANQANDQEAAEAAAGLAADKMQRQGGRHTTLNSQQRVGAYAHSGFDKDTALLERIAKNTEHLRPPSHPPVGVGKGPVHGGLHQ
jgi:hypothetical protein